MSATKTNARSRPKLQNAVRAHVPVSLTFDGKTYENVSFGFGDIFEAEGILGGNLLYGDAAVLSAPSARSVVALLYIALRAAGARHKQAGEDEDVPYSVKDITDRIRIKNIPALWAPLMTAYRESGFQPEDTENPQ